MALCRPRPSAIDTDFGVPSSYYNGGRQLQAHELSTVDLLHDLDTSQRLSMDNDIEFGTPHYSNPFWSSTSHGTFVGAGYHSDNLNFAGGTIPFQHPHGYIHPEMNHSVFLSPNHEDSFNGHSSNVADYQLGVHHSCGDLNSSLGISDPPRPSGEPLTQMWSTSSGINEESSYEESSYSGDSRGSFSIPNHIPPPSGQEYGPNHQALQQSLCMNRGVKLSRDTDKNGSSTHGLITPTELTPERSPPPPDIKMQSSMSPISDDNQMAPEEPIKAKRRRRARRQQTPTQQETLDRKLLLERNRNAAARSRQKKKKWVDDITAKVNVLKDNYKSQKSQRDELEQEIQQLKLMLFLHSRSCNDDDIGLWIEEELKRVSDETTS